MQRHFAQVGIDLPISPAQIGFVQGEAAPAEKVRIVHTVQHAQIGQAQTPLVARRQALARIVLQDQASVGLRLGRCQLNVDVGIDVGLQSTQIHARHAQFGLDQQGLRTHLSLHIDATLPLGQRAQVHGQRLRQIGGQVLNGQIRLLHRQHRCGCHRLVGHLYTAGLTAQQLERHHRRSRLVRGGTTGRFGRAGRHAQPRSLGSACELGIQLVQGHRGHVQSFQALGLRRQRQLTCQAIDRQARHFDLVLDTR